MIHRLAVFAACCALAAPVAAHAQSAPPPAGESSGIWSIQDENASITTQSLTDRYYVNGFHIGWTSPAGTVPDALAGFGHAIWGDGSQRISISLTQKIYTPGDTAAINPPLNDEPYAGYLAASFGLIQDTTTTRSVLAFSAGVVGRGAGAEIVQNGFHTVIGQHGTHGWAYQLPSEPAFDFLLSRTWRVPVATFGGLAVDALPQLSGMAGTTEIYLQPAVNFRIGEGLDSDFGAPLLRPGPSGSNAYRPTRPFVWYLFAGAGGKFVGHDEFLQGSDFRTSRSVDPYRTVGQFDAGLAIIWHGVRISYTQVFQTKRFHGEVGGIHEYGSLNLAARF
jgi:lipid A 3-O-deacylase